MIQIAFILRWMSASSMLSMNISLSVSTILKQHSRSFWKILVCCFGKGMLTVSESQKTGVLVNEITDHYARALCLRLQDRCIFRCAFSRIHIAASCLRFSSFRRQCLSYFPCLLSLKFPFCSKNSLRYSLTVFSLNPVIEAASCASSITLTDKS